MGEAEAPRSWPGVCSGEAERLLVGFQEQFVYQGQNPTMRQHCREITLLYLKERSQDDPKESLVCVELMTVNWGPPHTQLGGRRAAAASPKGGGTQGLTWASPERKTSGKDQGKAMNL